jgi:hypothetical protein
MCFKKRFTLRLLYVGIAVLGFHLLCH